MISTAALHPTTYTFLYCRHRYGGTVTAARRSCDKHKPRDSEEHMCFLLALPHVTRSSWLALQGVSLTLLRLRASCRNRYPPCTCVKRLVGIHHRFFFTLPKNYFFGNRGRFESFSWGIFSQWVGCAFRQSVHCEVLPLFLVSFKEVVRAIIQARQMGEVGGQVSVKIY